MSQVLKKKSENLSEWYIDVIQKAELADYGPVKGTIIFRPYGYALWEAVQNWMNPHIKEDLKTENGYFPLFIPENFLKREKEHVEGFSPELAVVTIAGGEELKEKLVVRPTSETIMYEAYSRWIHSHRDLPLAINQWNSVVRWEKRPYVFLRNTEFLWQEGHTAHATHEESAKMVQDALSMYISCYKECLALYGIAGRKSESEKFAGAAETYTFEMLMPDGKALQGCTSHDLGQNFSKAFDVSFQDKDGNKAYVWQTSWGYSTRSLGGLIMTHGDDKGLVLPPAASRYQIVIIPILKEDNDELIAYCESIMQKLPKALQLATFFDSDSEHSAGYKFNHWELKGVPVRLEIGNREMEKNEVVLVRRDTGEKMNVAVSELVSTLESTLSAIQKDMYEKSKKFTEQNTHHTDSYDEFKKIMSTTRGFIRSLWCEKESCEAKIKEETKASTRCLPFDAKEEKGVCIYCGESASHRWLFAQAY